MTRSAPLPVVVSIVLAFTALLLWSGTGRAFAHTELEMSVPAADEVVSAPPATVELTFSSDVQPDFAQVTVTGPDGGSSAAGPVTVDGPVVQLPVDIGTPGDYVVAYRIVSTDGHPVEGQYRFTYRGDDSAGAEATPSGTESAPGSPTAEPTAVPEADAVEEAGSATWLWAGLVAGAAAGAAVLTMLFRRRRRTDG